MKMSKKKQDGAVLLWGIVILLTLTVIGIAASRMATVDSRIAGNQMMSMQTFQGSESALGTAATIEDNKRQRLLYYSNFPSNRDRIMDAANLDVGYCDGDSSKYYCDPLSNVSSDPVISADPSDSRNNLNFPVLEGIAISSDMLSGSFLITIIADATIPGVGASSSNVEGWVRLKPQSN